MDATIFVEAQGSAIIGLSGVDKSLLYLAGTNDITNARVGRLPEAKDHNWAPSRENLNLLHKFNKEASKNSK